MRTVYNQRELEEAIRAHETRILCKGAAAEPFLRKRKVKRGAIAGGVLTALAGIAAIPFTGGASAAATFGAVATLTVGTVTISTAELAILCGTAIAMAGIIKGGKVKFVVDPVTKTVAVEFEPKYKN